MRRSAPSILALLTLFSFSTFGSGCNKPERAATSSGSLEARKAAVEQALQRYSDGVAKMDAAAVSGLYTADGELRSTGATPVKGREAIREHLEKLGGYRVESNVVASESVSFDGSDAIQKAAYRQKVLAPSGQSIEAHGRLEAVWTLESDGVWRLKSLTAFPDPPETPRS